MTDGLKLNQISDLYIPDGSDIKNALQRTTVLCIAAHQDDAEIMAYHAIQECYHSKNKFFTSIIITDGAGSEKINESRRYSAEEIKKIRLNEQKRAAKVGKYSAQIQMGYSSGELRGNDKRIIDDLTNIIIACKPEYIFTHNLADKHPTHVAAALRAMDALKAIEDKTWLKAFVGLEVWRGLDWLSDDDKLIFDASQNQRLARSLIRTFKSQIKGGKRYDDAVLGRRRANAVFYRADKADEMKYATYGMDMSEIVFNGKSPEEYISEHINGFKKDIINNIEQLK
ncbi:MAG: PIG-L family deacetylase [Clostridia bacterium]|nr:PIG-L family deacetylase [Clostridia bacterium]